MAVGAPCRAPRTTKTGALVVVGSAATTVGTDFEPGPEAAEARRREQPQKASETDRAFARRGQTGRPLGGIHPQDQRHLDSRSIESGDGFLGERMASPLGWTLRLAGCRLIR
jgi:hypothetical protein